MNRYTIEFEGKRYVVEASSDQEAVDFVRQQAAGADRAPPLGMTAQQAAEASLREGAAEAAYRQAPVAAGVASATRGVPFVGEYLDEAVGMVGGEGRAERMRLAREGYETANPGLAIAGQIGAGVATGLGAANLVSRAAPGAVAAASRLVPSSTVGQVLAGAGVGGVAGATEGAVSGYGAGEGGDRVAEAGRRAALGGALGAGVTAAAPLVARGVRNVVETVRDVPDAAAARRLGVSPEAAEVAATAVRADMPGAGARMRAAGPDAMLADAGPTTARVLDTAIQRSGPAAARGRGAVGGRVRTAVRELNTALDDALGRPAGVSRPTAAESAARRRLYDAAYAVPIDYSAPVGREIEGLLPRVPAEAIRAANKLMQVEGVTSRQILADIAEDGSVAFRQMPDVRQLDYITRGLNQVAEAGEDAGALGGRTPVSRAYAGLSREIRAALKEAVPEYADALNRAATDIGLVKARELGEVALRSTYGRGDLAEELADMPDAARTKLKQGVRAYIEETMANTRRAMSDGDMTAREGAAALRALSSRAARDKMRMILGDEAADALVQKLDRAATAFELRARVADNSATMARQAMERRVSGMVEPNAVGALMEGDVAGAGRRVIRALSGVPANARQEIEDRIYSEVVDLLTGARGDAARRQAVELVRLLARTEATAPLARRLGQAAGTATAVGGYQSGAPLLDR